MNFAHDQLDDLPPEVRAYIRALEEKASVAAQQVMSFQGQVAEYEGQVAGYEKRIDVLQQRIDRLEEQFRLAQLRRYALMELEYRDGLRQLGCVVLHDFYSSSGFFYQRGVLLGYMVHLANCFVHLFNQGHRTKTC